MTNKEKLSFDEPKTYSIAKFRLVYSILSIIALVGIMIFSKEPTPPICFGLVALFAVYLFLPFAYKLIISDEAISSISVLGTRTLEWNEVAEIKNKNGNLLLINRDGDVQVTVNQQIDGYPNVVSFIKQQRPELWKLNDIKTFHQNIFQSTILGIVGLLIIYATIAFSLEGGFFLTQDLPSILFGLFIGAILIWQAIKIREITFDIDYLVAKYIVWERRFHVNDIQSVNLEQRMGKNEVSYPVHVKLKNGKQLVIEKAKEGNPMLASAIETWMNTHKGKQND